MWQHNKDFFNMTGYVTKSGQAVKDIDEVAYFAFLKEKGQYHMIYRDACSQSKQLFKEQGCRSSYGKQAESKCVCKRYTVTRYSNLNTYIKHINIIYKQNLNPIFKRIKNKCYYQAFI